jgi:hypothetical protein
MEEHLDFTQFFMEQGRLDEKLGRRGHGEKRVQDALAEVYDTLGSTHNVSVHGDGEDPGLYQLLAEVVAECVEVIPGDEHFSQNTLSSLASVIGFAFSLGRYAAGGGDALKRIQRFAFERRAWGRKGGEARTERANRHWRDNGKATWWEVRGRLAEDHPAFKSQEDCAEIIWTENRKNAPKVSTIVKQISKWESELRRRSPSEAKKRRKAAARASNRVAPG